MNKLSSNSNSIVLMNGAVLECYPKETPQTEFATDKIRLDTTGVYLSIGNKPSKPQQTPTEEKEQQKKLFTDNAFYILAHSERIMRDSRMFLAPVAVQNGLAYTGTSGFNAPTLGIYLEWWAVCTEALRTDNKGNRSLVFHLLGSPLSGSNHCSEVYEDGRVETVQVYSFIRHWQPFTAINTRYDEAKHIYQAYTLEQVLDILHAEDCEGWNYSSEIMKLFFQSEIKELKQHVERLTKESAKWRSMYVDTWMKCNDAVVSEIYDKYQALQATVDAEIEKLSKQKQELKAKLKRGDIDNITYQRTLHPLKKRIFDLRNEIGCKNYDVFDRFHKERIDYYMIEKYIQDKKKNIKKQEQ